MTKEALTQLREVHAIQGRDGCWDIDDYMLGLYNGLELALSIVENRACKYKQRPKSQPEQEPTAWEQFYPDIGKPQIAFNAEVIGYVAPQRTWVGLDWLPKHRCGLHLSHNEHRDVYETVEEFYDVDSFISMEELAKAISEDSVWVLHWYPETPIGFHRIAASTLEAIEAKLKQKNG